MQPRVWKREREREREREIEREMGLAEGRGQRAEGILHCSQC